MRRETQAPGFVIAATGLRVEARLAARIPQVRAIAGGGEGERLEQLIGQAIAQGGHAIISFGIAAGLAPGREAGTCLVGGGVMYGGLGYSADPGWTARLKAAIAGADLAIIAGVDRPLQTAAEKHALHAKTRAVAADMESHIVAQLAARHRLPFAVLRVIADPAERELPPAALVGIRQDGGMDVRAVLASLARSPIQLPALMRLAADTRRAVAELLRCHNLLGPGLGFFDLA